MRSEEPTTMWNIGTRVWAEAQPTVSSIFTSQKDKKNMFRKMRDITLIRLNHTMDDDEIFLFDRYLNHTNLLT